MSILDEKNHHSNKKASIRHSKNNCIFSLLIIFIIITLWYPRRRMYQKCVQVCHGPPQKAITPKWSLLLCVLFICDIHARFILTAKKRGDAYPMQRINHLAALECTASIIVWPSHLGTSRGMQEETTRRQSDLKTAMKNSWFSVNDLSWQKLHNWDVYSSFN